jgi:hypothetical protein
LPNTGDREQAAALLTTLGQTPGQATDYERKVFIGSVLDEVT